jgi:hypothetical protein
VNPADTLIKELLLDGIGRLQMPVTESGIYNENSGIAIHKVTLFNFIQT